MLDIEYVEENEEPEIDNPEKIEGKILEKSCPAHFIDQSQSDEGFKAFKEQITDKIGQDQAFSALINDLMFAHYC